MKKRIPFAVCLHHTGVRGVGAKQHAKKKPVFGKKKFHGIRRFHGTLVGVSLKDLWKSSNINGLQAASKAFIL